MAARAFWQPLAASHSLVLPAPATVAHPGGRSRRDLRLPTRQVYGAQRDPSINHLIISRAPPSVLTWDGLAYNTNSDYQSVHFSQGQGLLIYLLWAGKKDSGDNNYGASFQ